MDILKSDKLPNNPPLFLAVINLHFSSGKKYATI